MKLAQKPGADAGTGAGEGEGEGEGEGAGSGEDEDEGVGAVRPGAEATAEKLSACVAPAAEPPNANNLELAPDAVPAAELPDVHGAGVLSE